MSDHYRTLVAPVEFRHKIERSEFLGFAFPVTTEDTFFEELTRAQKRWFDATHHCWAFRLFDHDRSRSSDAGEPSGTAGKPILSAIEGAAFHDVAVIVVRWYGGIKLGTGGLSRAYRETAALTFQEAAALDRYLYTRFIVAVSYDDLGTLYRLVSPPDVLLTEEVFGEENQFVFDVRTSKAEEFAHVLTEKRLSARIAT